MPVKKVQAGNVFYCPGQPAEVLFLLKKGRVDLYHLSAEGTAFTTATVEEGSFFGEMAFLGQSLYGSYAEAVTPCLLCIMTRQDVKQTLLNDLRISSRVVETLGRRLIETEQRLADMPGVGSVEVTGTHEELAQGVGAYRETVTKILNEWRGQGLVELGRGRAVLLETEKLRHLCAE